MPSKLSELTSTCQSVWVVFPKETNHQLRCTGTQKPTWLVQYCCVQLRSPKSCLVIRMMRASISALVDIPELETAAVELFTEERTEDTRDEAGTATVAAEDVPSGSMELLLVTEGMEDCRDDAMEEDASGDAEDSGEKSVIRSTRMMMPPASTVGLSAPKTSTS